MQNTETKEPRKNLKIPMSIHRRLKIDSAVNGSTIEGRAAEILDEGLPDKQPQPEPETAETEHEN